MGSYRLFFIKVLNVLFEFVNFVKGFRNIKKKNPPQKKEKKKTHIVHDDLCISDLINIVSYKFLYK